MRNYFFFLAVFLTPLTVSAQSTFPATLTPPTISFGMVGVSIGQNARVVVSNVASPLLTLNTSTAPTAPCGVTVKFLDKDGNTAGVGGQITNLAVGQSYGVDLPGPTSGRTEYRAQVQSPLQTLTGMLQNMQSPIACTLIATFQVYDVATGKTDLVLQGGPIQAFPILMLRTGVANREP